MADVNIETSWKNALSHAFEQPYFKSIKQFIIEEKHKGKTIYPPGKLIFNAFDQCAFNTTKVVLLGQDPYHGPNQAHGLCFSVQDQIKVPPSLKNIYKELQQDCDIIIPDHGNLTSWAKQGVLMLNAVLTVNAHEPASHKKAGWEYFTNEVIETLSKEKEHLVFILWGNFAKSKAAFIDSNKHLVLTAAHPSPFSAHNGFFGCKHFSKCNDYLQKHHIKPINWQP